MDQHAGNLPTSSLYPSKPQQWQYNALLPPHTLPPLQGHHGGLLMHSMYGQSLSAPHTPTMTTPNTSISAGNGESALRGHYLQGAPYQQPFQPPPTTMPPPTSLPVNNRLVLLRSMSSAPPLHLQHGMHPLQPALSSGYGLQFLTQDQDTPTHVVGSQGRRGILPNTQGRPSVGAIGTGSTMPTKDADGKFPCPHCTKTFLNAKHLKRHLLRHTGNRPYNCVLCGDTFSRSDILKKHFQKCSIRRGNPTGASHLSAQAQKSTTRSAVEDLLRNTNGVNSHPNDSNIPDRRAPDGSSNMTDDQVKQEQNLQPRLSGGGYGGGRNRQSLTGLGISGLE